MANKTYKILAVDDNRDNLITLHALIHESFPEFAVYTAQTGVKGLELASAEDIDVVLLDIVMPGMDGFSVCRHLKADKKTCDIPVVFVTAIKGDTDSRIRALETGAEGFLAKPVDVTELVAQIRAMIKIRAANIYKNNEKERLTELVDERTRELQKEHMKSLVLLDALKKENEARKKVEISLLEAQRLAHIGSFELDMLTNSTTWTQEGLLIYGVEDAGEMDSAEKIHKRIHPEDRADMHHRIMKSIAGRHELEACYRIVRPDGEIRSVNMLFRPLFDDAGKHIRCVGTVQDVTERKAAEDTLTYMSYHDQLTGLYNRRYLEMEMRRLDTPGNLPVSVIMGDLNGLKLINDSLGHSIGDDLLRKAADVIRSACRRDDIIARTGGDEFIVLLPGTDALEATQILGRMKSLAACAKVESAVLSISFGYQIRENMNEDMQAIIANAENDMYRHKLYENSSMRSKTIDMIMNTLFEKSDRELMHSKRVSEICEAIAAKMDFDTDEVSKIKTAGLLHDIGKIGVDEKILNKPQRLDNIEWLEMRKHPEASWRILNSALEFSELANFVLEHHERWDGKGYPNGLQAEQITLEARIISIADAYDAMTSERSYRKGLNREEACDEIRACSGTQFDPRVARVFIEKVIGETW